MLADGSGCGNGFATRKKVRDGFEEYLSIQIESIGTERYRYRAQLVAQEKQKGKVVAYGSTGCGAMAAGEVWKDGDVWRAKAQ